MLVPLLSCLCLSPGYNLENAVEQQINSWKQAKVRVWWKLWLILAVVLSLAHLFCLWFPVSQGQPVLRSAILTEIGFFLLLVVFLVGLPGLIVVPISPILIWRSRGRLRAEYVRLLVVGLIASALMVGNQWARWNIQRIAFVQLANRSTPLVAAISRYEQDRGHPPKTLSDLVPGYLSVYPQTGLRAYPGYHYRVLEQFYVYYELGKHSHGRVCVRPDICIGSSVHRALLRVYYDGHGRVSRARTESMPPAAGFRFFDPSRWKQNPKDRIAMARDLIDSQLLLGKSEKELTRLLGPPKGLRKLSPEPWELAVHCGSGGISLERFFYWPSERYDRPGEGYIQRIGDWAYRYD